MFWEGEIAVNSFIRLQSRNFLITEFGFPVGFKIGRYCGFSFVFKLLKRYFYQVVQNYDYKDLIEKLVMN